MLCKDDDGDEAEEEKNVVETELEVCNGANEIVYFLKQKNVLCFDNRRVYAFRHCGCHSICENSFQDKGDVGTLKCINCRA